MNELKRNPSISHAAAPLPSSPARGEVDMQHGRATQGTLPLAGRVGEGVATSAPFAAAIRAIPVTVVTAGDLPVLPAGTTLVTIGDSAGHEHSGAECLVCSTRGNVRVLLFELLEQARRDMVPAFASVVVDARHAADPQAAIDALTPGKLPAFGLRDHTVARSFRLAGH